MRSRRGLSRLAPARKLSSEIELLKWHPNFPTISVKAKSSPSKAAWIVRSRAWCSTAGGWCPERSSSRCPGRRADGTSFIDEAVNRGAVAIVTQKMPVLPPARVTFIQVADARASLARVAQRYYKFPDRDMTVVGVTGTNGKTTVTHLLKHFLNSDQRVGLIGTINYDLGARTVPSFRTTPESLDIYGMMAQMRDAGCRHAVMEVSSHGIDQQRVLGLQFGAAVFTNLTRDHLDYHETLEAYFAVKARLFDRATPRRRKSPS